MSHQSVRVDPHPATIATLFQWLILFKRNDLVCCIESLMHLATARLTIEVTAAVHTSYTRIVVAQHAPRQFRTFWFHICFFHRVSRTSLIQCHLIHYLKYKCTMMNAHSNLVRDSFTFLVILSTSSSELDESCRLLMYEFSFGRTPFSRRHAILASMSSWGLCASSISLSLTNCSSNASAFCWSVRVSVAEN